MRAYMFASVTALSAAAILVVACAGNKPPESASPGANQGATQGATDTPAPTPAPSGAPSAATTTKLTLADGGDLSTAKLTTHSTTTVTTGDTKSDAGVKKGPEPGRTVQDIQAIIVARRDEARACYDNALKTHPGIEGDVDIKWLIDPKGNPLEVTVDESKSTIHEDTVWKCLVGIVQKIKFAPSAKGFESRTHYPFNFHPKTFMGGAHDAGN